ADHREVQIFSSVREAVAHSRESGRRRVLVPTMGALHRGHGELIRIAREAAGKEGEVAVSIFVNPLQFAPGSDYEKYPQPAAEYGGLRRKRFSAARHHSPDGARSEFSDRNHRVAYGARGGRAGMQFAEQILKSRRAAAGAGVARGIAGSTTIGRARGAGG